MTCHAEVGKGQLIKSRVRLWALSLEQGESLKDSRG